MLAHSRLELLHPARSEQGTDDCSVQPVQRRVGLRWDLAPAVADQLWERRERLVGEVLGILIDPLQILLAAEYPPRFRPGIDSHRIQYLRTRVQVRDDFIEGIFDSDRTEFQGKGLDELP